MTKNPILDELRETRERLLAEAGGTLDGLVDQLQHEERQSGRRFISPKNHAAAETRSGQVGTSADEGR